jgi:hypothetical protein
MGGPNSAIFEVSSPEAGEWRMVVSGGAVVNGNVEVLAFSEHDGVQLNVNIANPSLIFPDAVHVRATPLFEGEAIVGATVAGTVLRPDGSRIPIVLHDDGSGRNGDAITDDGIYSAFFSNYSEDGTYTFDLSVVNVSGTTYAGEDLFRGLAPSNEAPAPPFTRVASATAVISGIPEFLAVPLDVLPRRCPNRLLVPPSWPEILPPPLFPILNAVPVAVLGTMDFSVSELDLNSIRVAGVAAERARFRDVAKPFEPFLGRQAATDCTRGGPDGFEDLIFRVDQKQLLAALGPVAHGDVLVLPLTGQLHDGTQIKGEDVVVIRDPFGRLRTVFEELKEELDRLR